ncbi:MAG: TonB-dependent receptor [Balneolales bacterium]
MNTMNTDQGVRLLKMSVFTVFFGMLFTFQMSEGVEAKNSPDMFAGFQQVQKSGEMSDLYVSRSKDTIPTVSLNAENVLLVDILHQLAEELNVDISMNTRKIEGKLVNYQARDKNIYSVLNDLLYDTELEVHLSEDQKVLIIQETEEIEANEIFQETIEGRIVDAGTGEALPGVNIVVQGTETGTSSDFDGRFELTVPSLNETLVFSFIGYETQQVPIEGRTELEVSLNQVAIAGEELVVIGYGTQRRENVSGSVGRISTENVDNFSTSNTEDLLQGKVPGVRVTSGGGAPDADATVVIRGTGTFGNDQPLYVIDGLITSSMSFVNPRDIESIEILKDASTAAIYGNRAANGVVLVTTKRGEPGAATINVSSSMGFQEPTNTYDFLNAEQYAQHNNQTRSNDGLPLAPGNTTEFDPSVDTDWQDVQLNNLSDASIARNNISVAGGNETARFFVAGEHLNRIGIVKESDFKRYGLRVNSDFMLDKFMIKQSLSATRQVNNPNIHFGRERGALPTIPVYDEDNLGGFAGVEPSLHGVARGINWYGVAVLNEQEITTDRVIGNVSVNYEFIEGLEYNLNLGLDYGLTDNVNFMPAFFMSTSQEAFNDNASLSESTFRSLGTLVENTINYTTTLGQNHNIDLLGGFTQEKDRMRSVGLSVTGFATNELRTVAGSTEVLSSNGELLESVLTSVFGRINYNYAGKYILSGTVRRDGSSKFSEGNRWGTFPSVSAAWTISEESFFPEFFDEFKFRASYGELGSQNIGEFATITGLNVNSDYYFAGGAQSGTSLTSFANPNVIWERSETVNGGIDMTFLDNRVTLTLDYFDKESEGVLANTPIPGFGGVGSSVLRNAASIHNYGFEFGGTYRHHSASDFNYTVNANFSILRNEVLALGEGVNPISGGGFTQQGFNATRTAPGRPIGSFYGWVVDGIFQSQEEADASPQSAARPGDFKYKDLNGDGVMDDEDRTYLGNPQPDFEYGVSFNGFYRNFDIGLFIQGVQGNEVWNAKKFQYILDNAGGNKITTVLDSWTPENKDTNIPRATFTDPNNNKRESTFFIEDGSYLRLKSLQIGYQVPVDILSGFAGGVNSVRLFVNATNLITITNYSGYDPEVGRNSGFRNTGLFGEGVDTNAHPNSRTYTLGIDVSF